MLELLRGAGGAFEGIGSGGLRLFGFEFADGGGYFVFPGEFWVLGGVVGREVGNPGTYFFQDGAGFVQVVPADVGLAIGPRPAVGFERILFRLRLVADG